MIYSYRGPIMVEVREYSMQRIEEQQHFKIEQKIVFAYPLLQYRNNIFYFGVLHFWLAPIP